MDGGTHGSGGRHGEADDAVVVSRSPVRQTRREAAGRWRGVLEEGRDPIDVRDAERAAQQQQAAGPVAVTFERRSTLYMAAHEAGWRNAKHRQQWHNTLATYAYPVIGALPVDAIDAAHIMHILSPIWTEKNERRAASAAGSRKFWTGPGSRSTAPARIRRAGPGISNTCSPHAPRSTRSKITPRCRGRRSRNVRGQDRGEARNAMEATGSRPGTAA
jgi:hypothetical protein